MKNKYLQITHLKLNDMKKTITLEIPPQLEMLCGLLGTTPQRVIQGFIDDVSLSRQSGGGDERMMATGYFLRCGHGMQYFDYDQQREMLEELNQLRYDFYEYGNDQMEEYNQHVKQELEQWQARWNKTKESTRGKGKGL